MEDISVGRLWKQILLDCGKLDDCPNHGNEVRLIRKLVAERKLVYLIRHKKGALWTDAEADGAERLALRDFGIDAATWEKKP